MPKGSARPFNKRTKILNEYQKDLGALQTNTKKYPSYTAALKQKGLQKKAEESRQKALNAPKGVKSNITVSNKFPTPEDTKDGWKEIRGNKNGTWTIDNSHSTQVTPGKWKVRKK